MAAATAIDLNSRQSFERNTAELGDVVVQRLPYFLGLAQRGLGNFADARICGSRRFALSLGTY